MSRSSTPIGVFWTGRRRCSTFGRSATTGPSPRVLDRAGVADADLVAAVINSAEVNQIPAVTAKELGA